MANSPSCGQSQCVANSPSCGQSHCVASSPSCGQSYCVANSASCDKLTLLLPEPLCGQVTLLWPELLCGQLTAHYPLGTVGWGGMAWGQFGRNVKLMTSLQLVPNAKKKKDGDALRDEAKRTPRPFRCFVWDFFSKTLNVQGGAKFAVQFKCTGWCKICSTV